MRILFCNYEYPPLGGGAGVMNQLLAQDLATRHKVTVLTSQALGLPSESVEHGVRIVRVPVYFRRKEAVANIPSLLAFIPMGIKVGSALLKSHQFDVINTHFALPTGPVGDVLSRLGNIPNVLLLHGGDMYDPSKFTSPHRHPALRAWVRCLLRRADLVVGQSRDTLDNMRRFYAPGIEAIRIPALIRRPEAGVSSRQRYGCAEDEVLLVTVGRLVARKAIAQMIALMESLRQEKARLLVMGIGPQDSSLKEECRRRGLGDKVLFLGYVEESEKFRILRMSDLYVSTSQHEGFGLVFLEAMACGLPIICYDRGGQRDYLEDGVTGHLVPLNDQANFEARCRSLIRDPGRRRSIGQENLRRVEEFFVDRCALRYEALFEEVASWNGDRSYQKERFLHAAMNGQIRR